MLDEKIRTLKEMVMTATELDEPWDYFFDHLANDPDFMAVGKVARKAPLLTSILETVGGQALGSKAEIRDPRLCSLRKHHIVHGACLINGCLSAVIYFTDVKMGVLSINDPGARPHNTYFVRFTNMGVLPAADDDGPTLAPVPPTREVVN